MNTTIVITVYSKLGTVKTYEIVDGALEKFNYVVEKFSRFDTKSELSKLNQSNGKFVKVSDELIYLVKTALEISRLSKGKFDPTIIDVLETYGFDNKKDFSILDNKKELENKLKIIKSKRRSIDEIEIKDDSIKLAPGQRIDLGGIGKGYAIDLAAEFLIANDINDFIINAGGDIYANGKKQDKDIWSVGLAVPGSKDLFGLIELSNASLASSGTVANRYKQFNHLIDPEESKSVSNSVTTYVVHDKAMYADAYATMIALMGKEGLNKLDDLNIGGLIIEDQNLIYNKNFPEFSKN